ncbi:MAG: ribokinase [Nitrospinota bacterium]
MHSALFSDSADIVVIGSANEDLVVRAHRLPRPGETVLGGELQEFFGGKGANQAVAAHRAGGGGARVVFLGKLGADGRGDRYARYLESEGLDVSALRREKNTPTGVALIVVGPDGENLITVAPGANMRLSPGDIEGFKRAIQGAHVVLAQLEVPRETVESAFRRAARAGVRTLLNPAPAPEGGLSDELLSLTRVLIPNRPEAGAFTGIEIASAEKAEAACKALRESGPESVVITLGGDGAAFAGPEGFGHIQPPCVGVVDTTGAGDAFCGALAVGLAEGEDLPAAVRFACAAGALSCTVRGAQPSLPSRGRIESLLAQSV